MTSFERYQLPNHHGCALKISNSVPPTPYKKQLALHIMLIGITTQSLQLQIFAHFLWSCSNFCPLLGVPFHRAAFNRLVPCVPTSRLRFIFCLQPAACVSLFVFTQLLTFHFLSSPLAGGWSSGHNRPACLWCCFRQTFIPCMSVSCLCFTFCLHHWQEIGLQVVTDLLVYRPIVPIWEFDDRVFFAAGQPPPQGSPAGR